VRRSVVGRVQTHSALVDPAMLRIRTQYLTANV
jgi:hypothetical protein